MTIYQLKELNQKNGGCFFCKENMRHSGDTLRNLGVRKLSADAVEVYRKTGTPRSWVFNKETGRMV